MTESRRFHRARRLSAAKPGHDARHPRTHPLWRRRHGQASTRARDDPVAAPVLDLLIRLWLAQSFWVSGIVKLSDWNAALYLAAHEYPVSWMNPVLAAWLGITIELVGPLLLALGLATRFAAIPMLILALVVQYAYLPLEYQPAPGRAVRLVRGDGGRADLARPPHRPRHRGHGRSVRASHRPPLRGDHSLRRAALSAVPALLDRRGLLRLRPGQDQRFRQHHLPVPDGIRRTAPAAGRCRTSKHGGGAGLLRPDRARPGGAPFGAGAGRPDAGDRADLPAPCRPPHLDGAARPDRAARPRPAVARCAGPALAAAPLPVAGGPAVLGPRRPAACGRRRRRLRRRGGGAGAAPRRVPGHADRPAQLPPVPAAAVPGGDGGPVAGRYRHPDPRACSATRRTHASCSAVSTGVDAANAGRADRRAGSPVRLPHPRHRRAPRLFRP